MKTIRGLALCLIVMLFMPLLLHAQDLSKYRGFSFGMSPAAVLKQTDMKMADVKTLHSQPALIQELTWWLPMLPGNSYQADSVREILFTFCNGQLYRMSATYDRSAIEGLTAEDLVQSIAAKYGPPIKPRDRNRRINGWTVRWPEEKVVALWEDAQYSLSLNRSYLANGFTLVMYSLQDQCRSRCGHCQSHKTGRARGPAERSRSPEERNR